MQANYVGEHSAVGTVTEEILLSFTGSKCEFKKWRLI